MSLEHVRARDRLRVCLVTFKTLQKVDGGIERFLEYFSDFLSNEGIRFTMVSPPVFGIKPFKLPLLGFTLYSPIFSLTAGIKIVLINRSHDFSLIHSIECGYGGLAGLIASKVLKKPFIVHAHCIRARLIPFSLSQVSDFPKSLISLYEKYQNFIDKLVFKGADVIIAVSNEVKRHILSLGISPAKVIIKPMGISIKSFKPKPMDRREIRDEFRIPSKGFVIGYIGRLDPCKGLNTLIEACSLLKKKPGFEKLRLLIVGDGNREEKDRLDDIVRVKSVSSVIFTGFREDVARILSALDVFVLPSFFEGCPFSLLEAMAAGKAIVASDIPSIREIVHDQQEALLFKPGDINMLEKTLFRLCCDVDLREELGSNAERKANQYSCDSILSEITYLYSAVVKRFNQEQSRITETFHWDVKRNSLRNWDKITMKLPKPDRNEYIRIRKALKERLVLKRKWQISKKLSPLTIYRRIYKRIAYRLFGIQKFNVKKVKLGFDLGVDEFGRDVLEGVLFYTKLLIARGLHVNTVVVLGSRAKGRWKPESAVDVVVIADNLLKGSERKSILREGLIFMDIQADGFTPEEFLRQLQNCNMQVFDAIYYGKVVYDRGFWSEANRKFKEMEEKYELEKMDLKKYLFIL